MTHHQHQPVPQSVTLRNNQGEISSGRFCFTGSSTFIIRFYYLQVSISIGLKVSRRRKEQKARMLAKFLSLLFLINTVTVQCNLGRSRRPSRGSFQTSASSSRSSSSSSSRFKFPSAGTQGLCSGACGRSRRRFGCGVKIIGGTEACRNEFPWAALLEIDGVSRCGGNLINDRFILTAGHCVEKSDPKNVRIRVTLGEHNTDEREEGELKFTVTNYQLHPRYRKTSSSLDYDFALIKIPKVDLRKYRSSISPVCLPGSAVDHGRGRATAYGWGQETILFTENIRHNGATVSFGKGANQSTKLQTLDLNFLPQSECVRDLGQLGIEVGASSVCAVSSAGDTCAGDSGSGLVRARGDTRELVGLVSYGVGCDSSVNGKKLAGVYARVSEALNWIRESVTDGQCYT